MKRRQAKNGKIEYRNEMEILFFCSVNAIFLFFKTWLTLVIVRVSNVARTWLQMQKPKNNPNKIWFQRIKIVNYITHELRTATQFL